MKSPASSMIPLMARPSYSVVKEKQLMFPNVLFSQPFVIIAAQTETQNTWFSLCRDNNTRLVNCCCTHVETDSCCVWSERKGVITKMQYIRRCTSYNLEKSSTSPGKQPLHNNTANTPMEPLSWAQQETFGPKKSVAIFRQTHFDLDSSDWSVIGLAEWVTRFLKTSAFWLCQGPLVSQRCQGSSTWKPAGKSGELAAESDRMVSARKLSDGDIISELCQRAVFWLWRSQIHWGGWGVGLGSAAASVRADAVKRACDELQKGWLKPCCAVESLTAGLTVGLNRWQDSPHK